MNPIKKIVYALLLCISVTFLSCEDDFNRIGTNVVSGGHFDLNRAYIDVFSYNRNITSVQTNALPIYQLGRYTDPVYGEKQAYIVTQLSLQTPNPTFGAYDQAEEDNADTDDNHLTIPENETITQVYLDIPFFSTLEETDEDGNRTFTIDSTYGNAAASFQLRVEELTYYLRDLDPVSQFQQPQKYFSDQDFSAYTGALLYNQLFTIDPAEIVIYKEDDPETEKNEAEEVKERLTPRIRIPLNSTFFQQKIIDAEGSTSLLNNVNFHEYFRGLYISTSSFSDDLLMLFDLSQAQVTIEYEYDKVDTKNTDTTDDDEIIQETATVGLSLAGNIINSMVNSPYPPEIDEQLNNNDNASRLYLQGGQGTLVEIKLFDEDDSDDRLNEIKANNWLINEANLTFYIDRETLDNAGNAPEPQRIYVYDLDTNIPIIDYYLDGTANILSNSLLSRTIYGGVIEKDDDGKGIRYKIRLTDHINNILRKDAENVRLGLVIISDINSVNAATAHLNTGEEVSTVTTSVINPLSTVLYGSHPDVEEDKRLRLEIFYTQPYN
jgi:hypothetical protein